MPTLLHLLRYQVANAEFIELGTSNFEKTLTAQNWTCVLFYDGLDDHKTNENKQILDGLDQEFASQNGKVAFAALDIRRHKDYRTIYQSSDDPAPFFESFYSEYPYEPDNALSISSTTFMNIAGDLYWNTRLLLFAKNFNVYGEMNLDYEAADAAHKLAVLSRWIQQSIEKSPEEREILVEAPIFAQREYREAKLSELNDEFEFDTYDEVVQEQLEEKMVKAAQETPEDEIRNFVLETGVSRNWKVDVHGHYQYKKKNFNAVKEATTYIEELAETIQVYLTWAASYEVYWDEERKAREESMTKYGTHLETLNQKVHKLFDEIFDPKDEQTREMAKTKGKMEIPPLRQYLEELVLGYGRSPESLRQYVDEEIVQKLGASPEERRNNRKNAPKFDLVERMKEHMQVWANGFAFQDRYTFHLADLSYQWHNLLVEFHDNLHKSYAEYLEQNPVKNHEFPKQSLSVVDAADKDNHALLSNYDEFHNLYTKSGTPVVLSNVNMTTYHLSLNHILEQCGHIDVTSDVKISPAIGEKSNKEDAGLKEYELEHTLVADHRLSTTRGGDSSDDEEDSSDDDTKNEVTYDPAITLKQFELLKSHIPGLYLHDWSIGGDCDSLFYDTTLYNTNQTFLIPTVFAGYDLSQRVTLYPHSRLSPILTMGAKGTNEKLQVSLESSGYISYLMEGRKRWTIYHSSERPFLYQRMADPYFAPDVLGMDKTKTANEYLTQRFPLLHRTEQVYEFVQEPGQLIYIPPNSPFAMENLEDVVEIGMVFFPREAAFGPHLHHQIHKEREFGFTELALRYKLFDDNADKPARGSSDSLYMTLLEYKSQV